jgi:hypothetical protein
MSLADSVTAVPELVLEAVTTAQDAVWSTLESVAQSVTPLTEQLSDAPFADQFPDPGRILDSAFGFAEKFLANQRQFTVALVDACRPAAKSTVAP